MKKYSSYISLALIIAGVLTLSVTRFVKFTNHNSLLLAGLFIIIAGIIIYIWSIKTESKY